MPVSHSQQSCQPTDRESELVNSDDDVPAQRMRRLAAGMSCLNRPDHLPPILVKEQEMEDANQAPD